MVISELLTVAGIIILGYGLLLVTQFRRTLGSGSLKEAWDVLSLLIVFFILGYLGFLAHLVTGITLISPEQLTAVVFFFGAIFVAMVAHYNKQALDVA